MSFPDNFYWGAATSSYQVEGAVHQDGRGATIWDTFSHTEGKINNAEHGDIACDHYNRYADDVRLMQSLNFNAYRFSFAWSRILPKGIGEIEARGLDFYDRLLDALLEADIQPFATLYHWDLPQALQDKGGWTSRESMDWFAEYTHVVTSHFADRVKRWSTFNEPYVTSFVGHWQGRHAPGIANLSTALTVAHHVLLSHGKAIPIIRENVVDAEAGIVLDLHRYIPKTDSPADIEAHKRQEGLQNHWFSEPVFNGKYPEYMTNYLADYLTDIDLDEISGANVPLDFIGINYYMLNRVEHAEDTHELKTRIVPDENAIITEMNWEVYPQGLYDQLMWLTRTYDTPTIYITENGAAFNDSLLDGEVNDSLRVNYFHGHIQAVQNAINDGADVRGYFAWSLMDNFEWALGYDKRFGIIYVDFETLERTPKNSAKYYSQIIKHNAVIASEKL
ncbi:MAG: GH1 family beta-glucosidase [Phototrophicaceae bacterium]